MKILSPISWQLTFCLDTTWIRLWGIDKITVVKILTHGMQLSKLGNLQISLEEVKPETTKFVAACYGLPALTDMTALRYSV